MNPIFQKQLFSIFCLWPVSDYLGFLEASCDYVSKQNKGDTGRNVVTIYYTEQKPPVVCAIASMAANSYNTVESSLCS